MLEQVVRRCNERRPDLVLLTGDLIEAGPASIAFYAGLFGALKARLGVYAILGGHDKWRSPRLVTSSLTENGIRVLCNEAVPVGPARNPLWIVGLDDNSGFGIPDFDRALRRVPPGAPMLMMMHSPDLILQAAQRRVPLVLSGHTHGGQVCIPFFGPLRTMSRYGRRFASGRCQVKDTVLYTNRGLGSHFSLRFLARPEVLCLTLRAGRPAAAAAAAARDEGVSQA